MQREGVVGDEETRGLLLQCAGQWTRNAAGQIAGSAEDFGRKAEDHQPFETGGGPDQRTPEND